MNEQTQTDNAQITTYWSAIPECMRSVVGDPFTESLTPDEFREKIEAETDECEHPPVEWHDDDTSDGVAFWGIVAVDGAEHAETDAASLAMELGAFHIVRHEVPGDSITYVVGGATPNKSLPESNRGWFNWMVWFLWLNIPADEYTADPEFLSQDAARWRPSAS